MASFNDGPDEWEQAEMDRREKWRAEQVEKAIRELHDSLPKHSSDIRLFTFAECKQWGLKKNARRSYPLEDDGA